MQCVSFGKLTGFQGIHFVLSLDFIVFFFMYKLSFLSVKEFRIKIYISQLLDFRLPVILSLNDQNME